MRVVTLLGFVILSALAVVVAAFGVFFVWVPFSSDPPDTASGVLIGLGCFCLALMLAWVAIQAWRSCRE